MKKLADACAELDSVRVRRAKELSDVKQLQFRAGHVDPYGVVTKAVIVLSYSHWEGFFNDCVDCYLSYLRQSGCQVQSMRWTLVSGLLTSDLQRLRDKNHSLEATREFTESLENRLGEGFQSFDATLLKSRSNLNFTRLQFVFQLLGFEVDQFQSMRLRIDKELVGWRHSIAHGDNPDLTAANAAAHVDFVRHLLSNLSDVFQMELAKVEEILAN